MHNNSDERKTRDEKREPSHKHKFQLSGDICNIISLFNDRNNKPKGHIPQKSYNKNEVIVHNPNLTAIKYVITETAADSTIPQIKSIIVIISGQSFTVARLVRSYVA